MESSNLFGKNFPIKVLIYIALMPQAVHKPILAFQVELVLQFTLIEIFKGTVIGFFGFEVLCHQLTL